MKIHKDFKRRKGMFEFETQLNKLKHEVLTEVAKLAMKDKLTKEVFNRSNLKASKKTVLSNDKLEKYQDINLERD